MPSLMTTRGILGHFPRGMDPPANDRRANTPPVRPPTSLSLRAISAAGARGRSGWAGARGRRATREVRGGGAGEAGNEGWSGESGGRDATLDAGMEEEEKEHAPLAALP